MQFPLKIFDLEDKKAFGIEKLFPCEMLGPNGDQHYHCFHKSMAKT